MMGLLGTVSHEFFHAWNVERIRPRSLEPFDFTDANMSGELWLAEGFTNYYGAARDRACRDHHTHAVRGAALGRSEHADHEPGASRSPAPWG